MSEQFITLQNTLRKIKNNGVDLAHPHGVRIGTKLYPAIGKNLAVNTRLGRNNSFSGSFRIPLENGLHVRGGLHAYGRMSNDPDGRLSTTLHLSVMAPIIHQQRNDPKYYGHQHSPSTTSLQDGNTDSYEAPSKDFEAKFRNATGSEAWIPLDANHENPHDAIAHFSKRPYHGFATFGRGGYVILGDEELAEHRKNFKVEPDEFPKTLKYYYAHPGTENSKSYNYNFLTEEFREQ